MGKRHKPQNLSRRAPGTLLVDFQAFRLEVAVCCVRDRTSFHQANHLSDHSQPASLSITSWVSLELQPFVVVFSNCCVYTLETFF